MAIALLPFLIWVSVADLKDQTIPDTASFCLAGLGVIYGLWAGPLELPLTVASAIAVVSGLSLIGEIIWRRTEIDALGLGDVKLIGAGILVVGSEAAWLMVLLASVGGIVAALFAGRREERGIPFAPFLAYAIFVTFLMTGPPT